MIWRQLSCLVMMSLLVAAVGCQPAMDPEPAAESVVPKFEVDPSWPMLPNDWVLGAVASVDVDSHDHVWIYHRPRSVDESQQANALFVQR